MVRFVNLLVVVVPTGVHHAADGAGVEDEVGLPQLQMELRIAPLLADKLAVPGARLPLLRHGAIVVFKKFSFPKITNKGHLTYKNYLLETK